MAVVVDLYQEYNNVTDWRSVKTWADGCYLKVSDGTGEANYRADAYAHGCDGVDIPRGGYHFAETGDPVRQADVFSAALNRLGNWRLAPALDLEENAIAPASRVAFAQSFCDRLKANLGVPAVALYSSTSWLASLQPDGWNRPWLLTWAAEYGINNGQLHPITHYTGRVGLHQYTSTATRPGVAGACDLSWTADLSPFLNGDEMNLSDQIINPTTGQPAGFDVNTALFYIDKFVSDFLPLVQPQTSRVPGSAVKLVPAVDGPLNADAYGYEATQQQLPAVLAALDGISKQLATLATAGAGTVDITGLEKQIQAFLGTVKVTAGGAA